MVIETCLGLIALCKGANHFLENYVIPEKDLSDFKQALEAGKPHRMVDAVHIENEQGEVFSSGHSVVLREDEARGWHAMSKRERLRALRLGLSRAQYGQTPEGEEEHG